MIAMPDAPTCSRRPRGRMWGTAVHTLLVMMAVAVLAIVGFALVPADVVQAQPQLGIPEQFWVEDWSTKSYRFIQASPRYVGDHVAVYVQDYVQLSDYTVSDLGTTFDGTIYPTLTAALGSEPNPGIDGDHRIAILIYDFNDPTDSIDGSFNYRDIDPPAGSQYSNRREMFYLNLRALETDPYCAANLAAHEFVHLIVHYRDAMLDPSGGPGFEPAWLVEGLTTYGEHLAGYDGRTTRQVLSFCYDPNFNLTYWEGVQANYGASYLFMRYLLERQGPEFVRTLVDQPLDGVAGVNAALASVGSSSTFEALFDDWILANFLDGKLQHLWPYSYSGLNVSAEPVALAGPEPILGEARVANYGAVYLDFPATANGAPFQVVVDGNIECSLQAALIAWDSAGILTPSVTRLDLTNAAAADTVSAPAGYDRHTLSVWTRGTLSSPSSWAFQYSGALDPPGGVQFLDMGGDDGFYTYAASLLARGVISGKEVPQGSGLWFFEGAEKVTRAQFAKMIMLATAKHTTDIDNSGPPRFPDVVYYDQNGYPRDHIEEAAALGIVNGYRSGLFGPQDSITRAQLVLMIVRGAAAAETPLSPYAGNEKVFADVSPSHQYYREIMTAYTAGILSGSEGGDGRLYFRPYSSASRNHVAKMTAKLVEHLDGAASPEDPF
ncbi:MAG: S-layer homology domain-containing protein [Thermoleophilia bacterium]|nr:S-layer homology domain-containing protein [Thermoleophilia bacterium]